MTRPRYNAPPADYSVLKVTTGSGWLTEDTLWARCELPEFIEHYFRICAEAQVGCDTESIFWAPPHGKPVRVLT